MVPGYIGTVAILHDIVFYKHGNSFLVQTKLEAYTLRATSSSSLSSSSASSSSSSPYPSSSISGVGTGGAREALAPPGKKEGGPGPP